MKGMHTMIGIYAFASLSTQGLILAAWTWVYLYRCQRV